MRLIHNMSTITEYPAQEYTAPNRTIKIAVIGGSGVGKTALVVRFLTKRFIGDYERNAGNLYSREVQVDGDQVTIQVQDTPGVELTDNGMSLPEHVSCSVHGQTPSSWFTPAQVGQPSPRHLASQQIRPAPPARVDSQQGPLLATTWAVPSTRFRQRGLQSGPRRFSQTVLPARQTASSDRDPGSNTSASAPSEKKRSPLIPRPKSPNMQDLKRRFKQALSAKVRTVTSV
ncbi:hypothetical protein WMY93_010580 [Mugilogobius chulae]|uniref:small monomeric GTPase n=1 Tax=Mugilogobius chulae TaxID=88201 RepID=A0AAW0PB15_9GOBI